MKLKLQFEIAHDNLINQNPVLYSEIFLRGLLCKEERLVTQLGLNLETMMFGMINVVYVVSDKIRFRSLDIL